MKTTIELPDDLMREVKARAALKGQTLKTFFTEAISEKISLEPKDSGSEPGWMKVAGSISRSEVEKVQKVIDEEFSKIDPDDWK